MATPSMPPTDGDENNNNFENMLELDLPLPAEPELPTWAVLACAAIAAVLPFPAEVAIAALQALIEPLRARPEGPGKVACRTAIAAKRVEIEAARKAAPASVPTTARQQIPVIRDVAPLPALVSPFVWSGKWSPLMTGNHASGYRLPTDAERRRRAQVDAWGALVEHNGDRPQIGAVVRVTRANNTRSTLHVITGIVSAVPGATVATVRTATDDDMRPRALAEAAATAPRPTAIEPVGESAQEPGMVEAALANIAEGSIAPTTPSEIVAPTERGNSYDAQPADTRGIVHTPTGPSIFERPPAERVFRVGDQTVAGQRATFTERQRLMNERTLIVGSLVAGKWLQVSWTGEGTTMHGAINDHMINIGREDDAPGVPSAEHYAGLAVTSLSSRDYDTKRLAKRDCPEGTKARWLVGRALQGSTVARAGDSYGTALLIVDLLEDDTLRFDGELPLANAVRSTYATSVAKVTLNSRVLTPWLGSLLRRRHGAVKRGHCWYVPPGHAAAVRALIGGPSYAAGVAAIIASGDEQGIVPKFDPHSLGTLWGDHEMQAVGTGADLLASLGRGLIVDIERVETAFADATVVAKDRARENATKKAASRYNASEAFVAQEGQAAFDRGCVSATVAAGLLRDLGTAAARVVGYQTVLGDASVTEAKARIATLRTTLEALTDDTSVRGAMLELE